MGKDMDKKASNEYVATTANGFVAVLLGLGLLAVAVFMVTRGPSLATLVLAGMAVVAAKAGADAASAAVKNKQFSDNLISISFLCSGHESTNGTVLAAE